MPKTRELPADKASVDYPAVGVIHTMLNAVFQQRAKNKEHYDFFRETFEAQSYLEEHCTLRLGFPRQMGNSVSAVHAANMLGIRKAIVGSGLVVVPYVEQGKILESYGAENVVSIRQIENRLKEDEENVLRSQTSIVVDCASYVRNLGKLDILYDVVDPEKGGWIVLIG
jgi:hypothetical protein